MREGERFPDDQAEVTLSTQVEDWVANNVERARWDDVLDDIVALFTQPWGKHSLGNRGGNSQLAGLNTTATLRNEYRIVYQVSLSPDGIGVIELWDYQPEPAPAGLVKSAVTVEALPQEVAELLAADEINAAMANARDPDTGDLDPVRALRAALSRVAGSADPERIIALREGPRCAAPMPRADKPCVRRRGHAGAHRATA